MSKKQEKIIDVIKEFIQKMQNGTFFDKVDEKEKITNIYKKQETSRVWWASVPTELGTHLFSFDKIKFYNLFQDFPYKLTKEEIKIFIEDEPYWADFFKARLEKK